MHTDNMPYPMAQRKPYEPPCRQVLWHGIIHDMMGKNKPTAEKPYADIAARIKWHREVEGLDQSSYASKAGLKRSQLSNWEAGIQCVSVDGARKLRRTYGLSMDFIFEGIDEALPMALRVALRDNPSVN